MPQRADDRPSGVNAGQLLIRGACCGNALSLEAVALSASGIKIDEVLSSGDACCFVEVGSAGCDWILPTTRHRLGGTTGSSGKLLTAGLRGSRDVMRKLGSCRYGPIAAGLARIEAAMLGQFCGWEGIKDVAGAAAPPDEDVL